MTDTINAEFREETLPAVLQERPSNLVHLGSIRAGYDQIVQIGATVANSLADIIKRKALYTTIQGRDYVRVEGWTTLGAIVGVLPREVSVVRHDDGTWEAVVELVRTDDGQVMGRASHIVAGDESPWNKRPAYAARSMAVTRATGRAYRLAYSWIMTLAGYEPTPAEEMEGLHPQQPSKVSAVPPRTSAPAAQRPAAGVAPLPDQVKGSIDAQTTSEVLCEVCQTVLTPHIVKCAKERGMPMLCKEHGRAWLAKQKVMCEGCGVELPKGYVEQCRATGAPLLCEKCAEDYEPGATP